MKTTIAIVLMFAAAAALPAQTKKKTATAPAAPVAKAITIPPGATANPDGTYSFTDKRGKHWIYNKTPFGISQVEDLGPAPASVSPANDKLITFTENGDSYKFVRKTPFGQTTWERKKTELNDEERHIVEAGKAASNPQ